MKAIVVIPTQGFGNRLRMLASSYILAQYMKLEHFVIWEPKHDCFIEFDSIWKQHPFQTIEFKTITESKYIYFGIVHTKNVMDKILKCGDADYIVLTGGHEFKHPAMNTDEYLHHKYKLYSALQFTRVQIELPSQYACVHIRNITPTDMNDVKKYDSCKFIDNSPIYQFMVMVKKINDNVPLVIISNDNVVAKVFQDQFPQKNIYLSRPESFDRDSQNGMKCAIQDFSIMTKALFIVGTYYSSFSDEASFFNMIPKIIPLAEHITSPIYHCSGYTVVNGVGYLNYDRNTNIKYLMH